MGAHLVAEPSVIPRSYSGGATANHIAVHEANLIIPAVNSSSCSPLDEDAAAYDPPFDALLPAVERLFRRTVVVPPSVSCLSPCFKGLEITHPHVTETSDGAPFGRKQHAPRGFPDRGKKFPDGAVSIPCYG